MGYIKKFRRRISLGAVDGKEFTLNEVERNFIAYLHENPTCREIPMTDPDEVLITKDTKKVLCAIHDLTNNDKRALDEKQVLVPKDTNVDVGCFFFWDNCYWVIVFKEHKSLSTYKKFIAKRCNQIVKYKYRGVIYPIPVSIENLTMYSDGLADLKYTSQQDSKRMITFGSNPITRTIIANTRFMLTGKTVFRVTHINDFEFNGRYTGAQGIIKTLVLQTTLRDEDDLKNNVAWNKDSELIVDSHPVKKIRGDKRIMVGSKKNYVAEGLDFSTSWRIDYPTQDKGYASIKINEKNELKVTVTENVNYIGSTFNIVLFNVNTKEVFDTLTVTIKGFS